MSIYKKIFIGANCILSAILFDLMQAQAGAITIPSAPLSVGAAVSPLVMLDITKDQNLFKKAYDDYTDLNADGWAETTYDHTIDYYGYFDSYKCYSYSAANGYFSPVASSLVNDAAGKPIKPSTCSGQWHGNFLNWISMSRMDAVRKLLYGGYRSTDSSTKTILERSHIPTDAHAWAKYYNPYIARQLDTWPAHQGDLTARYPDINLLTPYNPTQSPAAISSSSSNTIGGTQASPQTKTFDVGANTVSFSYGDQVLVEDASNPANYMIGAVSCVNGTGITMYDSLVSNSSSCSSNNIKVVVENSVGSGVLTSWKIFNYTQTGLTVCNATVDVSTANSQGSTAAPLMRVAKGNFSLWSANERWQCLWREDAVGKENTNSLSGATVTQGNRAALSGVWASSIGPNKTTVSSGRVKNGLDTVSGPDYNVRVEACVSASIIGNEKCAQYPSGNYKPIGLLQYYGESGQLKFGMVTGSYLKNKSGGTLRKNITNISDEINSSTDGTIKSTIPTSGSIIQTLNKMRIWGYGYSDGSYTTAGNGGDDCTYGLTDITEGKCLSWGNPMSEVYLESLRYLAGKSANSSFNVSTDKLGLTSPSWVDPITSNNYCAPLNVLVFNSAVNTYEHDSQMSGAVDLGVSGNTCNAATKTNEVGLQEGINGNSWFVGNNGTPSTLKDLCSSKLVTNFADVYGLCPEGAGTEGSYLMSGVAYFARTQQIRDPGALGVPATDTRSLKVSTYGIALASNTPKRTLTVGSGSVTIMPQGRLDNSGNFGAGTLVDWKIVCEIPVGASAATIAAVTKVSAGRCSTAGTGAFYWNQEDSEQGGDYDQDMWGRVQYQISGNNISVTTDVIAQSTPYKFGFGYAISGTNKDGPHFHSGINSFAYTDANAAPVTGDTSGITSNSCSDCTLARGATTATYTVSASSGDNVLKDPLWYAAKYGGFNDKNNNGKPDQPEEWDIRNSDGSTTGCTSTQCDKVPDNFFLVTNPNYLEDALDSAFVAMLNESSASAVATNSTSLQAGSYIYQARFNTNSWSGQLLALALNPVTGDVINPPAWDAGLVLNGQKTSAVDTRQIITYGTDTVPYKKGIPFTWSAIIAQTGGTAQQDALNSNGLGVSDGATKYGSLRLDYLRGSQSNEGKSATNFRPRATTRLGDIVNSSPVYVGEPEAGWGGAAYSSFRQSKLTRTPIVYVGANDGMLHAFKAADGTELLAYVPGVFYNNSALSSNLSQLENQSYSHKYFVDGSPMVNDIEVTAGTGNAWKTVLVGGLNWGGRAYYALDITDPDGADTPANSPASLKFSEANAANLLMWEFSSSNDSDLGYTHTQPTYPQFQGVAQQIVKMRNGKWALVVGNGYNSNDGKAALFIFFLDRAKVNGVYSTVWTLGQDYIKIVADMQVPSNNNGLSTPLPFSAIGDGIADWIYAGDLRGNLWKFDVTDANPANWKVAYNAGACTSNNATSACSPFYVAQDALSNRQPITTAPQVVRHPKGGVMVLFGTGKYLENSDTISPFTTQTYYGVWDNGANNSTNTNRASLLQQKVVGVVNGTDVSYRLSTDYCVGATGSKSGFDAANNGATVAVCSDNWSSSQKGWYMDLPTSGERVSFNSVIRNDRVVFPTLIPSTVPCLAGGDSWLMELDVLTGRRLNSSPFDVDGNGTFNSADFLSSTNCASCASSGIKPVGVGVVATPTVIKSNDPNKEFKYSSNSSGSVTKISESTGKQSGRITWREVSK